MSVVGSVSEYITGGDEKFGEERYGVLVAEDMAVDGSGTGSGPATGAEGMEVEIESKDLWFGDCARDRLLVFKRIQQKMIEKMLLSWGVDGIYMINERYSEKFRQTVRVVRTSSSAVPSCGNKIQYSRLGSRGIGTSTDTSMTKGFEIADDAVRLAGDIYNFESGSTRYSVIFQYQYLTMIFREELPGVRRDQSK